MFNCKVQASSPCDRDRSLIQQLLGGSVETFVPSAARTSSPQH